MKKLLIVLLLISGVNNSNAQDNTLFEAEGNLESPNPCGCVELTEITNKHNPADILNGMGKCIELQKFEKAAKLFAIAGVYGKYDTYRVKDRTAHQALLVLQQNIILKFGDDDKKKMMSSLQVLLEKGSHNLSAVCQSIQEVGVPEYIPKYMIQHGMQAFINKEDKGIVEDFDSKASWSLALESYLHCGE